MLGNLIANIDLTAAIAKHEAGDAEITAICAEGETVGLNHQYLLGEDGYVKGIHLDRGDSVKGLKSLEGYIIHKSALLRLMDEAASRNHYAFHRQAMIGFLEDGGKMDVYTHKGYVCAVRNVEQYYNASMDMLCSEKRHQIFPADRPVRTKTHEEVSTYFGEQTVCKNSLVQHQAQKLHHHARCHRRRERGTELHRRRQVRHLLRPHGPHRQRQAPDRRAEEHENLILPRIC